MLKRMLAALACAVALVTLAVPAAPAEETLPQDTVLATVDGQPVTLADVEKLIPSLMDNGFLEDGSDYRAALGFVIRERVLEKKIADMGFDRFSPEEEEALHNDVREKWEEALSDYVDYYLSEDSEEARASTRLQAEEFYASHGLTEESLRKDVFRNAAIDRMSEYLTGGYEPSEEEITEVFQTYGEQYQKMYENDISIYEFMTQYYGQDSWYTPEGYRAVIHILLRPDSDALSAYLTMRAVLEEGEGAETAEETEAGDSAAPADADPEEPEETAPAQQETPGPEALEAARQQVLDSRKDDIRAIYERIEKGEPFETLVGEYGEDPGMEDPDQLAQGYRVHPKSVIWDPVFTAGSFAKEMQKPGDVSEPVVSDHGIHIIKYLGDVPGGLHMSDDVRGQIQEYLKAMHTGKAFEEAFALWEQSVEIVYFDEAIEQAAALARARQTEDPEAEEPVFPEN